MWDNIGGKIKGVAKFIAWFGIIFSIIIGIILFSIGGNLYYGGIFIGIGLFIMIVGSLISWILSWFMYGFGELIVKTTKIERNTRASNIIYDYIVIKAVNLRIEPNLNSFVITSLSEGIKLKLIERGENITFENIEAPWFKVQSEDDEIGWCFSGFLNTI